MKHLFLILALPFFLAFDEDQSIDIDHQKELSKHLVLSTLWFQQSAEMEASYLQSYTWAKFLIDAKLDTMDTTSPKGVVLDIDETVLDNSPYEVMLIQSGKTYKSESWKAWTDQASARALPGALDFVEYATERNVEVFYISNRKQDELESTLKNLNLLGFPNADSTHVLLMNNTSDKTQRRSLVNQKTKVLLYIGDNLTDYSESFANRDYKLGKDLVNQIKHQWLYEFVMLPNPIYGEWESAIYENDYRIPDSAKVQKRLNLLQK